MKTAKDIIKKRESLRLVAYPDPGPSGLPWTIAWGHTRGVRKGDTCTAEQAEAWLDEDMAEAYAIVDRAVTVPLTTPQRDALCSFAYNLGPGAKNVKDGFVTLKNGKPSTMLRLLNAGNYSAAAGQFDLWVKAGGVALRGLKLRRAEEKALFLSGTNINPEPIPPIEEKPVAPFLIAAIPALINAIPEFAKIFKSPDVAERNVEAVVKASEIIMQATGATNVQDAVEKVQADPEVAAAANESLRLNRAELMDVLERAWDRDEASIAAARVFSQQDKPIIGRWLFVHLISLLFVILGGGAAIFVLATSTDPTERVMALQTLLIVGFASVAGFWLGSSRSSQVKDLVRDGQG
ncbi:MAG: lysozyme [Nevskia sp.]|jgi:lysozyme|nr:lysozyme [Nevskia sp.]